MSSSPDLNAITTPRRLLLGGGLLLLINSFLPWYHASFLGTSVSLTGWHQIGTLAWIVLIALLIWEGVRIAGAAPTEGRQADLVSAVGAFLVVVLGVLFVIQRLSDGNLGIGFWLGIVLLVVVGYGAIQLFQASGGQAALRDVQQQASERRAAPTAARPAPGATPQDQPVPPSAPAPQAPPAAVTPQDPPTTATPEGSPAADAPTLQDPPEDETPPAPRQDPPPAS